MTERISGTRSGSESAESQTLADRVLALVADARLEVDRRANATRPKSRRRRTSAPSLRAADAPSADAPSADELREAESLKRVFRGLGISYRRYRSQTREPVTPGLRDAAYNFRAEPSLTSLVAVAAYLDELDLLS
ncbi:MAG: hypothetical protein ACREMZ_09665 [Gemmatimonadales bacterium]